MNAAVVARIVARYEAANRWDRKPCMECWEWVECAEWEARVGEAAIPYQFVMCAGCA